MNYLEIDFNKVEGYSKLSDPAKELLQKTYKVHNSGQGTDYKEDWRPVRVLEHSKYLKVVFKNGEWLHYYPNGTWG